MEYSVPADQVVFESALVAVNFYATKATIGRRAPCWNAFAPVVPLHGHVATDALIFLHSVCTPKGRSQLIAVEYDGKGYQYWQLGPISLIDAGCEGTGAGMLPLDVASRGKVLRIYAGQPDPADPSHFTIGYEIDGLRGTLDGWFKRGGNRPDVDIEVRDGPASGIPVHEWFGS